MRALLSEYGMMAVLVVAVACGTPAAQQQAGQVSVTEELEAFRAREAVEQQNIEIMKRWFKTIDEGTNSGDMRPVFSMVDEVVSKDCVFHGAMNEYRGPEEFRQYRSNYPEIYGDLHHEIEEIIAKGDTVVTRSTDRAVQKGDFLGIPLPATGKLLTYTVIYINRFEDGQLVEQWVDFDGLYELVTSQLGMELSSGE